MILILSLLNAPGTSGTLLGHKTQQIWFRYYYSGRASDIRDLLPSMAVVASYEATEPRDKIFAIRGLLEKFGITLPLPDYGASLADVYWQATKVFLLENPEILYLVTGFPNQDLAKAPSWVPNFSDQSFRFTSPIWDLSFITGVETSRQIVTFPDPSGRLLHLEGETLDIICNVSTLKIWDAESSKPFHEFELLENLEAHSHHIIETLQGWAFMARRTALYGNGRPWQEAFLKTISSRQNGFHSYYSENTSVGAKELCSILLLDDIKVGLKVLDHHWMLASSRTQSPILAILKRFRSATIAIQNGISQQYISLLLAMNIFGYSLMSNILLSLSDNIFFITEKGYMGIGPGSIKEGDKAICIPGMRLPLVVRPIGERFTFVSAAHVHGIPETVSSDKEPLSAFILE